MCLQWPQPTCMVPVGGFVMDCSGTFRSLATWWSCYEECERANLQPNQKSEQSAGLGPRYTLLTRIHSKHSGGQGAWCKTSVRERRSHYFRQLVFGNVNGKTLFSFCSVSIAGDLRYMSLEHVNEHWTACRSVVRLNLAVHASSYLTEYPWFCLMKLKFYTVGKSKRIL